VRVASRSGGQIRVVGLSPNVQATFELARLNRIFDIFSTEREALAS
jgi:anti-anti-sigma regulatory factor